MRVAAVSPHFVVETPPGVEGTEQKIAAREIHHLRIVEPQTETLSQGEELKRENEEGIRRLARLIREEQNRRKQKQEDPGARADTRKSGAGSEFQDNKKRKALKTYQEMQEAKTPDSHRGVVINRAA